MTHGIDPNPRGSKYYAKASGMMGVTADYLQDNIGFQGRSRSFCPSLS